MIIWMPEDVVADTLNRIMERASPKAERMPCWTNALERSPAASHMPSLTNGEGIEWSDGKKPLLKWDLGSETCILAGS